MRAVVVAVVVAVVTAVRRTGLALVACGALAPGAHLVGADALSPVGAASAAERVVAFDSDADRERYERLLHEYRCLKCQNQSIADSGASLADDLRRQIHDRVVAGDDDAAIDDFLVSRYGEFVRYSPRFGSTTAVLWAGPFVLLAVGLGAGVLMARRSTASPEAAPASTVGADGDRLVEARRLLGPGRDDA